MKIPGEVKPALWGAAGGAVLLAIVGFTWGGWVSHDSAARSAQNSAEEAVVRVLAPICADKFRHQPDAAASLAELKEVDSWKRGTFVAEGGWATMPGAESPESGVARACAELLTANT